MNIKKKIVFLILDGFALGKPDQHNAIFQANPCFINNLMEEYPCAKLKTFGDAVGLPEDQMGNSEVGHITIGCGRVVHGDLSRINNSINDGTLFNNENLLSFIQKTKQKNNKCHVVGLLSPGGVHSHQDHFISLIEILLQHKIKVYVHVFLDGRDTAPESGAQFLQDFLEKFAFSNNFCLASVIGRYYAMDRDKRWERTNLAFDVILSGKNMQSSLIKVVHKDDFVKQIYSSYTSDISDEFMLPIINQEYEGAQEEDSILTINWRADRMRQISEALVSDQFVHFTRKFYFKNYLFMADYSGGSNLDEKRIIFNKQLINQTLGEVLAEQNLKQLRIAETEKYAHVTFFFDGGMERQLKGMEKILINSPKDVATYDLKPEMSLGQVRDKIIENIENFDVIIANFANLDMVGHTGSIKATMQAVKHVDYAVEKIFHAMQNKKNSDFQEGEYYLIISADHGNADEMFCEKTSTIKTCHTLNPVPFIVVNFNANACKLKNSGELADIAPTILDILCIDKPAVMSGSSLLIK